MTPEEKARAFVGNYVDGNRKTRNRLKRQAADLARHTHVAGVDLCMSKATEYSPRIRVLFRLAAQVALIAHGRESDKSERYLWDLRNDEEGRAQLARLEARL